MARVHSATEAVYALGKAAIDRAIRASTNAGSIEQFYRDVNMRNPSRSYFVRSKGRLHSLKAVVTHALREEMPEIMARDFHAADGAARLRELRYDVVHASVETERERQRVWVERLHRPGQAKFREQLIDLYGGCALTSCSTPRALEAAHVDPVKKSGVDALANGILLRADLHKLFDADLIAINPKNGRLHISEQCRADYEKYLGKVVFTPPDGGPKLAAFNARWVEFKRLALIDGTPQ